MQLAGGSSGQLSVDLGRFTRGSVVLLKCLDMARLGSSRVCLKDSLALSLMLVWVLKGSEGEEVLWDHLRGFHTSEVKGGAIEKVGGESLEAFKDGRSVLRHEPKRRPGLWRLRTFPGSPSPSPFHRPRPDLRRSRGIAPPAPMHRLICERRGRAALAAAGHQRRGGV